MKNYPLGYPVIDMHTYLRNNISGHTKIAKESGIDLVVYMANIVPPMEKKLIFQILIEKNCLIKLIKLKKNLKKNTTRRHFESKSKE